MQYPWEFSCDIDNIYSFAPNLAFCRQGFQWNYYFYYYSNLKKNLHNVYINYPNNNSGSVYKPIYKIHQFCFRRIISVLPIDIFVLFPELSQFHNNYIGNKFGKDFNNYLTNQKLNYWINKIILPAIKNNMPNFVLPEFPDFSEAALANSLASNSEKSHKNIIFQNH